MNFNDTPTTGDENETSGVLPLIKKKYMWVAILIIILGAFLPSFMQGTPLIVAIIYCVILLCISAMMYNNLYCFQCISFKYRPFLITKYIEYLTRAGCIALLVYTVPLALSAPDIIPFVILWILAGLIPYQLRSMFTTAKHFKEADPTKCEFC